MVVSLSFTERRSDFIGANCEELCQKFCWFQTSDRTTSGQFYV